MLLLSPISILSVYFVVLRRERTQYNHRLSAVAVISGGGSSEGGVQVASMKVPAMQRLWLEG